MNSSLPAAYRANDGYPRTVHSSALRPGAVQARKWLAVEVQKAVAKHIGRNTDTAYVMELATALDPRWKDEMSGRVGQDLRRQQN